MDALNMLAHLRYKLSRIVGREDGSSITELAIVFPFLLILFVGTAELGRLFYTYTTLAKATKVGARYLSTSRYVFNGSATEIANEKTKARNLVVCGVKSIDPNGCANQTPIVPGLTTGNVTVCDNFSVPCVPAIPAGGIKYFKVEITNYTYSPGVFHLDSTFYFALKPATEMRYMP